MSKSFIVQKFSIYKLFHLNELCLMMDLSENGHLEDIEDDEISEDLFEKAAQHVRTIIGTLTSENLLFFYGRYKQSTVGTCNVVKPSFFDFQGKQKWNAWHDLGDMSKVFGNGNSVNYFRYIRQSNNG